MPLRDVVSRLAASHEEARAKLQDLERGTYRIANALENNKISEEEYAEQLAQNATTTEHAQELVRFVENVEKVVSASVVKVLKDFETAQITRLNDVNAQIEKWTSRQDFEDPATFEARLNELGAQQQAILQRIQVIQGLLKASSPAE